MTKNSEVEKDICDLIDEAMKQVYYYGLYAIGDTVYALRKIKQLLTQKSAIGDKMSDSAEVEE